MGHKEELKYLYSSFLALLSNVFKVNIIVSLHWPDEKHKLTARHLAASSLLLFILFSFYTCARLRQMLCNPYRTRVKVLFILLCTYYVNMAFIGNLELYSEGSWKLYAFS